MYIWSWAAWFMESFDFGLVEDSDRYFLGYDCFSVSWALPLSCCRWCVQLMTAIVSCAGFQRIVSDGMGGGDHGEGKQWGVSFLR